MKPKYCTERVGSNRSIIRDMSCSSDEQARRSSEGTEATLPSSVDSKVQAAWSTVKHNFKARSSMPDLRRWWPSNRAPESNTQGEQRRPEDEEDSLFCDSLLGLMQQTGRFDYIDFSKEIITKEKGKVKKQSQEEDLAGKNNRANRFSWSSWSR